MRQADYEYEPDPWWKSWAMWLKGCVEHDVLDAEDVGKMFARGAGGHFDRCEKTGLLKQTAGDFLDADNGIFLLDGDRWIDVRKNLSPLFSGKALREKMVPVLEKKTAALIAALRSAGGRQLVDLKGCFQQLALDVICGHAFDVDPQSVERGQLPEYVSCFEEMRKDAYARSRSLQGC